MEASKLKLPTPWQEVQTAWSTSRKVRLLVKRDDLIHPLISGNKWRKLSGYVRAYGDFERINSFGGPYSNHIVAVAAFASEAGIRSRAFIRGERPRRLSTVLALCQYMGMELTFLSGEDYAKSKEQSGLIDGTLWVPEGGAGKLGMEGCTAIITETKVEMDHCLVASGTGTTAAGMLSACLKQGISLTAVPVLKPGAFISDEVYKLTGERPELALEHHFGGYARTTPQLMAFIQEFTQETGILLDPIYTGKAFCAARDMVISGAIPRGSVLGLIHTGGLTGWFGKWTEMLRP